MFSLREEKISYTTGYPTASERKSRRPKGKPVFYKFLQSVYPLKKECQEKNKINTISIITMLIKLIKYDIF